jgi:carboxymethylenebutenolidase
MKTERILIDTRDGPMAVHLHYPEQTTDRKVPAIIVLQEAFGVNANIRSISEKFARDGYLAVAPELFHRIGSGIEIPYSDIPQMMKALGSLLTEELTEDMQVIHQFLKNMPSIHVGTIGAIGFCMGGYTSLLGACKSRLDYAISCYGGGLSHARPGIGFTPIIDDFHEIHCPVFLLFGEKDQSIPLEQVDLIRGQLKRDQVEYEIKVYRGAGHAFLREGEAAYLPEAAHEAWKDIHGWLKQFAPAD